MPVGWMAPGRHEERPGATTEQAFLTPRETAGDELARLKAEAEEVKQKIARIDVKLDAEVRMTGIRGYSEEGIRNVRRKDVLTHDLMAIDKRIRRIERRKQAAMSDLIRAAKGR